MTLNKKALQRPSSAVVVIAWTVVTGVAVLAISVFGANASDPLTKALYEATVPVKVLVWVVAATTCSLVHLTVRCLKRASQRLGKIFKEELDPK